MSMAEGGSSSNALVVASGSGLSQNLLVNYHCIENGVYLGNAACAQDVKLLAELQITHILTIDLVPLQETVLKLSKVNYKYLKLADVPNEDLISCLPEALEFITGAVISGGAVLVHCYHGVSRSAAVVIAYLMQRHNAPYEAAFNQVKGKRHFICPNPGFEAQVKLFGRMGFTLDRNNRTLKQFRLRMAGQALKQVKILPQMFHYLIKPDPGVAQERPEPVVYRCRRCRRICAGHSNIIPHVPKFARVQLARAGNLPAAGDPKVQTRQSEPYLMAKLKLLAGTIFDGTPSQVVTEEGPAHRDGYHEDTLVDTAVTARVGPESCTLMWFVEPMTWMRGVTTTAAGKLHCARCSNKIGSYSWVSGVACPCGHKVAPAFYLVPSKVEYCNIVQNLTYTI